MMHDNNPEHVIECDVTHRADWEDLTPSLQELSKLGKRVV